MDFQTVNESGDRAITGVVETVRSYPGIMALIGLGTGWFIFDRVLRPRTLTERLQEEVRQTEKNLPKFTKAARETINESVDELAKKSQKAVETGSRFFKKDSSFVEENPFLLGFIGLSAGMVLGALTSGALNRREFVDEATRSVKEKTGQIWNGAIRKGGHAMDAVRHAF
jgi:ElaB/YqjD/DUF883 family membrane-anchored ribosome-binding protein